MKKSLIFCLLLAFTALHAQSEGQKETVIRVRWFGQTQRWENRGLGDSRVITIGTHGCALTAASMVMDFYGIDTNPLKLNRWLLKNNGFEEGWDDKTGKSLGHVRLKWDVPASGFEEIGGFVRYDFTSGPADLDLIRSFIDRGIPVIAEVRRPGGIQHFVVLNGYGADDFLMRDPLDEGQKHFSRGYNISDRYGSGPARNIFGIRVFLPPES